MALAADPLYTDTDKKLASYKRYETQFDNDETSTFKKIIYRRLADLKREEHFKTNDFLFILEGLLVLFSRNKF
jgi:hypothetical protein